MAIALITDEDIEGSNSCIGFTHTWKEALLARDPELDLRIWPKIGDPKDVTFALVWRHPQGSLNEFQNLKCIASLGAGVDHIMNDPLRPEKVPVVRVIDRTMAKEMTLYIVAAVLHHIKRFDHWGELQAKSTWEQSSPYTFSKSHIGVMGLGYLGKHAAMALSQLGLYVSGWSRSKKNLPEVQCFTGDDEFKLFLSQTDILICMLPLTTETKGMLNKTTFNLMPHGAYLINVARGQLLNEQDLMTVLEEGQLEGACLDTFAHEPLAQGNPLWQHPRVRITPHIASITNATTVAPQIIDNYYRCAKGQPLRNRVDPKKGY